MTLIAHYLGVRSQESGGKKEEETPSRRRKFFGERKGYEVLSRSYLDMISYLKLPTPNYQYPISNISYAFLLSSLLTRSS
ncbi:MAG: hypothetical protein F6K39_16690 [Okeania sp. SIO3B3]|nr:hypothetical protein [Okeania sp. SIO3B3]